MNPAEAGEFFKVGMGLSLSEKQVETLDSRTEGWIAGLQLAALSLRGRENLDEFVKSFGGSHRYVIDYLADEVFSQQSREIQSFLTQIAILDRFNADLCDVLTGERIKGNLAHFKEDSQPLSDPA